MTGALIATCTRRTAVRSAAWWTLVIGYRMRAAVKLVPATPLRLSTLFAPADTVRPGWMVRASKRFVAAAKLSAKPEGKGFCSISLKEWLGGTPCTSGRGMV